MKRKSQFQSEVRGDSREKNENWATKTSYTYKKTSTEVAEHAPTIKLQSNDDIEMFSVCMWKTSNSTKPTTIKLQLQKQRHHDQRQCKFLSNHFILIFVKSMKFRYSLTFHLLFKGPYFMHKNLWWKMEKCLKTTYEKSSICE